MTENRRWVPWVIVAFAAVFRLWMLAIKPPHFDEGVNGWFLDEMMRQGYFRYDPANYHGPLHFYILFIFKVFFGRNLWAIRLPVVIVSTLTVWLVTKFDRFMDARACWFAALAMAVSPGMEFYGRYAIHESEMMLFLILTAWGLAGMVRFGTKGYMFAVALGITGMILTKETYIIHLVAFALAAPCLWVLDLVDDDANFPRGRIAPQQYSLMDIGAIVIVCAALIVFFYSGNFMDWSILKGLYLTFGEWVKTGREGHGHEKVWYYWFQLAIKYEWVVLLGMVLSIFCMRPGTNRLVRYLMIYGWGAFTAYSIVHYKTPWCIITIMWPFLFVFGYYFCEFWKVEKIATGIAAAILLAGSLSLSVRLNFLSHKTPDGWITYATDEEEPYVYVQTTNDIHKLTDPLFKLVAQDRTAYTRLKGNLIMESSHPLPWVLGDFKHIGYYEKTLPDADDIDADFLLVDDDHVDDVQKLLKQNYFTTPFKLRGSLDTVTLYLNYDTFHDLFPGRKAEFVQGIAVPAEEPDDAAPPKTP